MIKFSLSFALLTFKHNTEIDFGGREILALLKLTDTFSPLCSSCVVILWSKEKYIRAIYPYMWTAIFEQSIPQFLRTTQFVPKFFVTYSIYSIF